MLTYQLRALCHKLSKFWILGHYNIIRELTFDQKINCQTQILTNTTNSSFFYMVFFFFGSDLTLTSFQHLFKTFFHLKVVKCAFIYRYSHHFCVRTQTIRSMCIQICVNVCALLLTGLDTMRWLVCVVLGQMLRALDEITGTKCWLIHGSPSHTGMLWERYIYIVFLYPSCCSSQVSKTQIYSAL